MKRKLTNWPISKLTFLFAGVIATFLVQFTKAESPSNPPGTYMTSWIGNTFMDKNNGNANVTEELSDVCLSPNGHVFTAGYAETGGGGAEFDASNGNFIARYDRFNSGFGDPTSCVAADNNFVYYGTGSVGILRANHGGAGDGGYTTFLGGHNIQGLYIKNGKLYVSDFGNNTIRILDLASMSETSSFSCSNPTRLTVDNNGNIWVVIWSSSSVQSPGDGPMWIGDRVKSFSPSGSAGPEITDYAQPLSVAIDNSGLLLVGGLSPVGNISKYNVSGTPSKVGTFGADQGIFSGTPGAFTNSAKLHWIKSIVVDASGNIITGCTYGSFWADCIEKWNSSGSLQWRDFAGTSLDAAGIDPNDDTQVYGKYDHYTLDYSKTTPGTEWSLKGFTMNRFKYPNDYRVDQNTDVGERSLGAGAFRIGGKLFVARSSQNGYRWELYRQETATDGEVLVPSVTMGAGGDANNHFYNASTKTWIDKPKKDNIYNQYWCVAKNGDIFTIGDASPDVIIQYKYGGLDANSNPIWDASNATTTPVPEFSATARRLFYDSDADIMYMTGDVINDNWGSFSTVKGFKNWSSGNRSSFFSKSLPYDDQQYIPDLQYGGGDPTAFSVAGNYLFILYGYGYIRVLDKNNGNLVGTLMQNVNGFTGAAGQVDASYGMTVTRRANDEYVILYENAGWANIMMIRWCPTGTCPNNNVPVTGVSVSPTAATVGVGQTTTITPTVTPSNATNKTVSWSSSNTAVATVNSSGLVTGVTAGTATITVTTQDGSKTATSAITVGNIAVTGVTVSPTATSISVGSTATLTPTIAPANATNKTVSWNSSNTAVATVSSSGLVTGVTAGTATITVTTQDGSKTATSAITVTPAGVSGDGLKGDYFNNMTLTGTAALSRTDATIDFDWGSGSYASGQPVDGFSARWTGQVKAQYSETYTFETESDDGARLWVNGQQLVNAWADQAPTKASGTIALTAGQKYDIKYEYYENGGGATARLRWSSASQAYQVIPQAQLFSTGSTPVAVTGVTVAPASPSINVGATQQLTATVAPSNATNQAVTWSSSNTAVATVSSSGLVTGVTAGTATITVKTTDGNKTATSAITVNTVTGCTASGTILYQRWDGISGTAVSNLTSNANYPNTPTSSSSLTSMEAATDVADNYGARIAGYICAPATGAYTFWIASDDASQLWLSTDGTAANKVKIAEVTSWTNSREWGKQTSQKSATINLTQGQSYYVEALMKEGSGGDNLAVGWLKPGQSGTVPSEVIPGSVLSPLVAGTIVAVTGVSVSPTAPSIVAGNTQQLTATVAPSNATNKSVTWSSSNTAVATVSSSGLVTGVAAGTATIKVTTTDGGKTATSAVTVTAATQTTADYEAENGTTGGGASIQNASNASNGKVVGNLNSTNDFSQVGSVNGGTGGTASLVIRYANGYSDNRSLSLYVNGTKVQQVTFASTGDWNAFASTASITITLNSGTGNTIKLQKDAADVAAADIDKYTVTTGGAKSSPDAGALAASDASVSVFPNPSDGTSLTIQGLSGKTIVNIYSLTGSLVYNTTVYASGDVKLDGLNLKPGVYILAVTNEVNSVQTLKIVIQ